MKRLRSIASIFAQPCSMQTAESEDAVQEKNASSVLLGEPMETETEVVVTDPAPCVEDRPTDSTAKRPRGLDQSPTRQTESQLSTISTSAQLFSIITMLTTLTLASTSVQTTLDALPAQVAQMVATTLEPPTSTFVSPVDKDMRACCTLNAVITKFSLRSFPEDEILVCPCCFKHSSSAPKKILVGRNRDTLGKFSSKSLLKNLKTRILSHFKSAAHEFCVERENQEELAKHRSQSVGLTLAHLALQTITEARSYHSYERAVLRQHLLGTRVGNLNHSRQFVVSFLNSLYYVAKQRAIQWFNSVDPATTHPVLFAVNADKTTEFHRTGQVVGALGFDLGEIKAIFLDDPIVGIECSGPAISENLFLVLHDTFCLSLHQLRTQLTGMAFDGQYFGLHVPGHFCSRIGSTTEWTMPGWDGAHRCELVLGDVRKDTILTWYKEVPEFIGQVQAKFAYGKNHEKLRKAAARVHRKFYELQKFCETRFAQAERKFYKNFVLNYLSIVTDLQDKAQTGSDEEQAYASTFLGELYKLVFVVTVIGLADLLAKVKAVSLFQQTVNTLPWEVAEKEAEFAHHFDKVYPEQLDFKDKDSVKIDSYLVMYTHGAQ
ncbi:hypothetical protein CYMTET_20009 [Cymbomonas tetramitiformis]|uniref:Uncharacterized protein n=1 Tax=Cymbomonas tetramitiformis TaxID=36881 RepID=A0AAE0G680_9CHLO|nr:hypothetical protein CYMTET_20009 [Cymbomonas tetramitiformis]